MSPATPARLLPALLCCAAFSGFTTQAQAAAPPLAAVPNATVDGGDGVQAVLGDASGRYLYRLTHNTALIGQYGISRETGALTALGPDLSAIPGGNLRAAKGSALASDPQGRFVYAAVTGGVASFRIEGNGQLAPTADKLAGGGNAASALSVSPDSRFLYALHCWKVSAGMPGTCGVAIFAIDAQSGALKQVTTNLKPLNGVPVVPVLNGGGSIATTPDGKYLLLSAGPTNKGTLAVYARNAGTGQIGALLTQRPTATGNPQDIVVTAKGTVYVAESEIVPPGSSFVGASAISAFQFNSATQTLAPVAGSPWTPPMQAHAIAVDNTGSRLYATGCKQTDSGCQGSVWAYAIDPATGTLTPAGEPQASAAQPAGIAIDPTSRYVYTANGGSERSGSVATFGTDAPSLSTMTISVDLQTVTATATLSNPGQIPLKATGFHYGTTPRPADGGSTLAGTESYGTLTATLSRAALARDATWYVQPYFTTDAGVTYLGSVASFTNGRVVQRMGAPVQNFNTLDLTGGLVNLHGQTAAKTGFRIGTGDEPGVARNLDIAATLEGMVFKAQESMAALTQVNTTYNIWPYVKTTDGETVYGEPYPWFNLAPPRMNVGQNFPDMNHVYFTSSLQMTNAAVESCGFVYATHGKPTVSDAAVPMKNCNGSSFATGQALPMYRDPASKFALGKSYFVRSYAIYRGEAYYSENEVILGNVNPVQLLVTRVGSASADFTVSYDINRINGSLLRPPYEVSWKKVGAAQSTRQPIDGASQQSGTLSVSPGISYTAQASFGYAGDKSGVLQTDVTGFTAPAK